MTCRVSGQLENENGECDGGGQCLHQQYGTAGRQAAEYAGDNDTAKEEQLDGITVLTKQQSPGKTGRKEIMELSNLPGAHAPVTSELDWHTDQSYTPKPVFGTILHGQIVTEASGNMSLPRIAEVAATGVDYISVGALTHSVQALDISLEITLDAAVAEDEKL